VTISENNPVMVAALERFYAEETLLLPDNYLAFLGDQRARQNDPAILSARGWTMHVLGDSEGGLAQVEAALEADPENPRALFDQARILLDTGRREEALPILETLAADDSGFAILAQRLLESR
jgi:tetratricopeptide (TPR) repeat protein